MDTELEQKIYRILIDNLPNDHNFTDVVNNLLALVERGCSEKAAYHQTVENQEFNYWSNFQQEIYQLRMLKQQEKIKSYRGKLKWEDNLQEMRTN